MHRRAFLDPRHLAESAGQLIGLVDVHVGLTAPRSQEDDDITLVRYARPAMGTVFEIVLPFGHPYATSLIHDALDEVDRYEQLLTVYRQTSEVSEVNRRAGQEAVSISTELHNLIQQAEKLSRWTGGAFDITAGTLIDAWGFVQGPKRVPPESERQAALHQSGFQHVELNDDTIRFKAPGLRLNFGSIGKGFALDAVAHFFDQHARGQPVLLHGGKSSVLAMHSPPGHDRGWRIDIEHPWNHESHLASVYLRDQALATSAATYKHLVHEGKKLGHILDPRTGWPASGIASATAITETAAMADALSTAFYVMGLEGTQQFCQGHPEVSAILLPEGQQVAIVINGNDSIVLATGR
ncbi:MAG: FAD:protein FMN transferase [Planctomycetia bacterium]|nr:FAD:protein FMN transferase [Planctomycetia bacterium]